MYDIIFTQYIFNYKINDVLVFVFRGTVVFYTVGRRLKYPQFVFSQ